MSFIDDMKIGRKMIGGFLIVVLVLVVVAAIGYVNMGALDSADTTLYEDRTIPIEQLGMVHAEILGLRGDILKMIAIPAERAATDTALRARFPAIENQMNAYRATLLTAEEKTNLAAFDKVYPAYKDEIIKIANSLTSGDTTYAVSSLSTGGTAYTLRGEAEQSLEKLTTINADEAKKLSDANTSLYNSSSMMMIIATIIGIIIAIALALFLSRSITGPVDLVNRNLKEMGLGHLGNRLKMNRKDEIGEMATTMDHFSDDLQTQIVASMQLIAKGELARVSVIPKDSKDEIGPALVQMTDAINRMIADADMLAKAAVEGKLDTRADASKHNGDYQKIVAGVNSTLDAVIGPLNVAAEYVDRISKGDIPAKITDNYNGDFKEIKVNLNNCIDNINALVADAEMLARAAVEGKLDTRADASRHHGDYRKIVQGVDDCLDSVINPLNVAAEYVDRISKGDIPAKITDTYKGDFNEIKNNLNNCIDNITALVTDAKLLSKAAVDGNLDTRADATKHQGDFRKIVEGVNTTLDSVIGPLNVAAEYVDRISKGDIPAKITENYKGDFNEIKNNLNNYIDGLQGLIECDAVLHSMALNDHTKKVEGAYVGVFATMARSTNDVHDRLLGVTKQINEIAVGDTRELTELKKIGKRSDQDLLLPAIIGCLETIDLLIEDTGKLAKAAVDGKLDARADTSRHHGQYKKIIEGVNATLDSVIGPVNEAMRISEEYAHCNFNARVDEKLKVAGDFVKFKDALNRIGSSVQETIGLVNTQTTENAKCNFTARIDDTAHVQGDFVAIKNSLNNVTSEVSKAFSSVNYQVAELAANAEEAAASTKEVAAGATTVAVSVNNVSAAAERGNEGIKEILKAVEDFSATVEEVTANTDSVTNLARETNKLTQSGAELASKAEQGMVSITKSSAEVGSIISDIKVQMNKIGEIVEIITNLANQTNLLALNAAIEAARAGDAGKGFAVVASEVKSLAQESRESAESIAQMISKLQEQSEKAAAAMVEANKEVRVGSGALTQTIEFFNKIVKAVDEITNSMEEVARASESQAKTVVDITRNVQTVSGIIQSTSKEATDAAAATEETSASIDQIASVMANVNKIVEKVTLETSKFRV
jgi:methyl-accepting chemotaxis protein